MTKPSEGSGIMVVDRDFIAADLCRVRSSGEAIEASQRPRDPRTAEPSGGGMRQHPRRVYLARTNRGERVGDLPGSPDLFHFPRLENASTSSIA